MKKGKISSARLESISRYVAKMEGADGMAVNSTKSTNSAKPANAAKPTNSVKPVKSTNAGKSVKSAKSTNAGKSTKWSRKKQVRRIQAAIFVIALAVFLVSGYQLLRIYLAYKKGSDEYERLADEAAEFLAAADEMEISGDGRPEEQDGSVETGPKPWEELYELMRQENEDYVGWITIRDTEIDYPIVQYSDNDYYLHHTFEGTENVAGTLFIDCDIKKGMEGKNVIVYGHNMKNGSMFAGLKKYRETDFYEEHKTFRVNTETGFYIYQIFAVSVVSPTSDVYTLDFKGNKSFLEYIDRMKEHSMYDTGVTVSADDQIITLSTCVNQNVDRLVVQAKRLEN